MCSCLAVSYPGTLVVCDPDLACARTHACQHASRQLCKRCDASDLAQCSTSHTACSGSSSLSQLAGKGPVWWAEWLSSGSEPAWLRSPLVSSSLELWATCCAPIGAGYAAADGPCALTAPCSPHCQGSALCRALQHSESEAITVPGAECPPPPAAVRVFPGFCSGRMWDGKFGPATFFPCQTGCVQTRLQSRSLGQHLDERSKQRCR